jgi:HlyD family secretion protein
MRRIPRSVLAIVAVAAVAVVLRLTVFRPAVVAVTVARVDKGLVEETVTNTRAGSVKAGTRAKLSPQTAGRVDALPYRKGDRVEAGALLIRLDDSIQRAQVSLAEEDMRSAGARAAEACLAADLASREWQRGQAMAKDGITSEQQLDTLQSSRDQTRAGCQAARATLEQSRANVRLARAELALTEVRAPFAGVIADLSTEVGEWITPSPPAVPLPAVIDLLDTASLYVSAPIDEVDSERVRLGQEVRITVDSRPGESFAGRLTRIAPYVLDVQEQNRTLEVEAEFVDPAKAANLFPGTSADIEVILSRRDGVLRVPTAAVAEGNKVLVLKDGRLVERTITTGLRNWRFTEVRGGLDEGDLVVTVRDTTDVKAGARARARTSV